MTKTALGLLYGLLACGACPPAGAAALKLVTWNLDWFTLSPTAALPADVVPRAPADILALARVAASLHADVVALQETDGPQSAAALFPPDRYTLHFTGDHVLQRTGFAIARGLDFTANPDVTDLSLPGPERHTLRSGADITLHLPGHHDLRLLDVHLKSGCAELPLTRSIPACQELSRQIAPLAAWIAARQQEGIAFVVMGDFNRVMDNADPLQDALLAAAPLTRATDGFANPCWGGERFIDHILLGNDAADWMVPHSLLVTTFDATGLAARARLSDHCPIAIRLAPPG